MAMSELQRYTSNYELHINVYKIEKCSIAVNLRISTLGKHEGIIRNKLV